RRSPSLLLPLAVLGLAVLNRINAVRQKLACRLRPRTRFVKIEVGERAEAHKALLVIELIAQQPRRPALARLLLAGFGNLQVKSIAVEVPTGFIPQTRHALDRQSHLNPQSVQPPAELPGGNG